MINYFYETDFSLDNENTFSAWLQKVVDSEGKSTNEINYIFCDDDYLLQVNKEYLNHDYYTDIITFDTCVGNVLGADIFISVDRVRENAESLNVDFNNELLRVMVHGILHLCGYKDKSNDEAQVMRSKEDEKINMFHVEQ
ncbi:rRNA maturation RNase YbeY [Aquimarina brevivitae]|uniref:Endoribonuclease YbeY n=1 Tax=Aquimarina brevivitae TaxID=323412 RepID=A0A4V2F7C4_9FLAO|nr:rRNA maturation RNase YbeY [Aquimarina brevivitae]RZS99329.1 rRNA maturation RNase YbeY [Aquimarina brevivitae]